MLSVQIGAVHTPFPGSFFRQKNWMEMLLCAYSPFFINRINRENGALRFASQAPERFKIPLTQTIERSARKMDGIPEVQRFVPDLLIIRGQPVGFHKRACGIRFANVAHHLSFFSGIIVAFVLPSWTPISAWNCRRFRRRSRWRSAMKAFTIGA